MIQISEMIGMLGYTITNAIHILNNECCSNKTALISHPLSIYSKIFGKEFPEA